METNTLQRYVVGFREPQVDSTPIQTKAAYSHAKGAYRVSRRSSER
jgi:hypothetical protein